MLVINCVHHTITQSDHVKIITKLDAIIIFSLYHCILQCDTIMILVSCQWMVELQYSVLCSQ